MHMVFDPGAKSALLVTGVMLGNNVTSWSGFCKMACDGTQTFRDPGKVEHCGNQRSSLLWSPLASRTVDHAAIYATIPPSQDPLVLVQIDCTDIGPVIEWLF